MTRNIASNAPHAKALREGQKLIAELKDRIASLEEEKQVMAERIADLETELNPELSGEGEQV